MLRVEVLRQRTVVTGPRHVVGDGRDVRGLLKARDDLLADRLVAGIDVVQVDCRRVRRVGFPEMRDGARQ